MKASAIALSAAVLFVALIACGGGSTSQSSGGSGSYSCSPTEYDAPYDIYQLKPGRVEVFGGVDAPRPGDVKGHAEGGMVGIEARCGSYVRVRGTTGGESGAWWGWVLSSDIDWSQ